MKQNGIIGNGHGKLGNTVNYVRGGQQITRVYQPVVLNPRTQRQELARARFKLANNVMSRFKIALDYGFAMYKDTLHSAVSFGVSKMSAHGGAINGNTPDSLTVAYDELQLSQGSAPVIDSYSNPSFSDPLEVSIAQVSAETANDNKPAGCKVGLVFVVYCPDVNLSVVKPMPYDNFTGVAIAVPQEWQGVKVHVYAFVKYIPESGMSAIPTDTTPWRYPAPASATSYLGFGNIS